MIDSDKRVKNYNDQYKTISNNGIESATSINDMNVGNNPRGHNTNFEMMSGPRNTVSTAYNNTTTSYVKHNTKNVYNSSSSSNHHNQGNSMNEIKTVSDERGNSRNVNYNSTTSIRGDNYQYSGNYKVYTPEEYAAKYESGITSPTKTNNINNNNYNNNNNTTYTNSPTSNPQYNNYSTTK